MADVSEPVENYRRGVDMETGVAWVEWDTEGGPVRREAFVSRADNVLVLRIRRAAPLAASIGFEQRPFLAPDAAGNITEWWVELYDPEKLVILIIICGIRKLKSGSARHFHCRKC